MANKVSKLSNNQKSPSKTKHSDKVTGKVPVYQDASSSANKVETAKKIPGFKLIPAVPKQ